MDDFFFHADLFAANATHFYFSEAGEFLGRRPKPCPRRKGFKGKETAGFGLRAGSFPLVK